MIQSATDNTAHLYCKYFCLYQHLTTQYQTNTLQYMRSDLFHTVILLNKILYFSNIVILNSQIRFYINTLFCYVYIGNTACNDIWFILHNKYWNGCLSSFLPWQWPIYILLYTRGWATLPITYFHQNPYTIFHVLHKSMNCINILHLHECL